MAKKTVVKKVLKFAPIKTEFFKALSTDETIKTNITDHMEDMPDETIIDVEAKDVTDEELPLHVDKETGEVKV